MLLNRKRNNYVNLFRLFSRLSILSHRNYHAIVAIFLGRVQAIGCVQGQLSRHTSPVRHLATFYSYDWISTTIEAFRLEKKKT